MIKKLFIVLSVVIIAVLIGIFGLKNHKSQTEQTEVVVWTLQMNSFADYINNIIKEYEATHPNIKIKWIDVPFSEGEKRTLASILSNNPPDLVNLNPDFSAILAQKDALEPINKLRLYDFNKSVVDSLKYNNKIYAIPWYATSAVTIYNKELFKKAGLDHVPRTYNEVAYMSKTVKTNTGVFAFFPTITENDTMLKILNKHGIGVNDSNIYPIDSIESVKLFNIFKFLYKTKRIPAESITQTHQEALEKYMSEQVVFYQGGANFLNMIKDNAPNVYKKTEVAPQFIGTQGQYDFSLMCFIIPKRAKHKKEALDFCLFLTSAKNQLELAKKTNVISTKKSALNDEFYNSDKDIMSRARKYSARQICNVNPVMRRQKDQKEINLLVNTAVQTILLDKGATREVLTKLKNDIYKLSGDN